MVLSTGCAHVPCLGIETPLEYGLSLEIINTKNLRVNFGYHSVEGFMVDTGLGGVMLS
jgi:hypothetical protein